MYLANKIPLKIRWTLTNNVDFVVLTHGQSFIMFLQKNSFSKRKLFIIIIELIL